MDTGGLSVMTSVPLDRAGDIQRLREDYLRTLVAPADGMWEAAVIAHATFRDIQDRGRHAGHFCLDSSNDLLRFHLTGEYRARAQEIFRQIIAMHGIRRAISSTIEPPYLSLCLDFQKSITPHMYLFRDHTWVEPRVEAGECDVTRVRSTEFAEIVRFYRANTDDPDDWIEAFVRERIARGELFALHDGRQLIAAGECIPSSTQPPYADLGMVVARSRRGRGLGSSMLIHLKERCRRLGWKPICSCAADNVASKRALEKAGFVSDHRMVTVLFPEVE